MSRQSLCVPASPCPRVSLNQPLMTTPGAKGDRNAQNTPTHQKTLTLTGFSQETVRLNGDFVDAHSPTGISAATHYGRSRVFRDAVPFVYHGKIVTKH